MTTTTTITRLGATTTAALLLLTGAALASPASAKDGADDNPSISDDNSTRVTADDNPRAGDDSTTKASSKSRARVVKRGTCTAATDWKLKAKPRDGRLEVEFEVDSNVSGQRWTYTVSHDGVVKASGTRTTGAPSGSFSVERRLPNAPGVHTISARGMNASTGETCQAALRI